MELPEATSELPSKLEGGPLRDREVVMTPCKVARALPFPICGPNRLKVTIKQLIDASKKPTHLGRMIIAGSLVYTVQVCGMIHSIEQEEDKTSYKIYDGTGSLHAIAWYNGLNGKTYMSGARCTWHKFHLKKCLGSYYIINGTISFKEDDISLSTLSARMVVNYNEITEHFLSTIQESLCLLRRVQVIANKLETVEWAKKELCKGAIRGVLHSQQMEIGLTSKKICSEVDNSPDTVRHALVELINEGEVYNTVDYFHYKLLS